MSCFKDVTWVKTTKRHNADLVEKKRTVKVNVFIEEVGGWATPSGRIATGHGLHEVLLGSAMPDPSTSY
jgi:hypothetical protein